MKICIICKNEKDFFYFGKDKHNKDGYNTRCKNCLIEYRKKNANYALNDGKKTCSTCKETKFYTDFPKNKQRIDGRHTYCKICFNKLLRNYRKKNPTIWEIQKNKNFEKWRKKIGISEEQLPRKRKNGEGYISRNGYLSFRKIGHPCADKNGRVQASHLTIYEKTGRILKNGETVHHINGDTLDNRLENLEIWKSGHPSGQRVSDKIKWCIEFLNEYGYTITKDKNVWICN